MRRLLVVAGALLVGLMLASAALAEKAEPQWDSPVGANEQKASGYQITLERSGSADFQRKLNEAIHQSDREPKIVGGTAVPDGKYRFMAYIKIPKSVGFVSCGGTLIDRDSVLSAAHCFRGVTNADVPNIDVIVGATKLGVGQGVVRDPLRIWIHGGFNLDPNSRDSRYDAAVLTLNQPVTNLKTIRLATSRQNALEQPGRRLTTAGWGRTSESGSGTDRMREVSVPVVSDAKAQEAYGSQKYFRSLMVAAGVKGKDSCQGDSGGPLFKPTTRTQVGIVSFGRGCGRAGFPGVYTEVNNPSIRSFITWAKSR